MIMTSDRQTDMQTRLTEWFLVLHFASETAMNIKFDERDIYLLCCFLNTNLSTPPTFQMKISLKKMVSLSLFFKPKFFKERISLKIFCF